MFDPVLVQADMYWMRLNVIAMTCPGLAVDLRPVKWETTRAKGNYSMNYGVNWFVKYVEMTEVIRKTVLGEGNVREAWEGATQIVDRGRQLKLEREQAMTPENVLVD